MSAAGERLRKWCEGRCEDDADSKLAREAMVVALEEVLASRLSADAAARALLAELKEKP